MQQQGEQGQQQGESKCLWIWKITRVGGLAVVDDASGLHHDRLHPRNIHNSPALSIEH